MKPNDPYPGLTGKRRRNKKKSLKRRIRRHKAVIDNGLIKSFAAAVAIRLLPNDKKGDLVFGPLRRKRQIVQEINAKTARMEADSGASNPNPPNVTKSEPELKSTTHELVNKGGRWVRRRRKEFSLW